MCSVSDAFVADARSVTRVGRHEGGVQLKSSSDNFDNTPSFSPADRVWILTGRNRVDLVSVGLGKSEFNSADQHQFLVPIVRHQGFVDMCVVGNVRDTVIKFRNRQCPFGISEPQALYSIQSLLVVPTDFVNCQKHTLAAIDDVAFTRLILTSFVKMQ